MVEVGMVGKQSSHAGLVSLPTGIEERRSIYYALYREGKIITRDVPVLILVGEGVKPAGFVACFGDKRPFEDSLKRLGLSFEVHKELPNGETSYCISYDTNAPKKAIGLAHMVDDEARELGRMLGFPSCCVEMYSHHIRAGLDTLRHNNLINDVHVQQEMKKTGLGSHILNAIGLGHYVPCCTECETSRELVREYRKTLDVVWPGIKEHVLRHHYNLYSAQFLRDEPGARVDLSPAQLLREDTIVGV